MAYVYFAGNSFDSENARNQYAFKHRDNLLLKQEDKYNSYIGWGLFAGFLFGLIFGLAASSWLVFFIFLIIIPVILASWNSSRISKIKKYANEYENFLINLEKNIRNDILKRFSVRYLTEEQKLEHIGDLINLINHKKDLNLNEKDGLFLIHRYDKECNLDLFIKKILKLKNKNPNNLAKILLELSPDFDFEDEEDYSEIFEQFCEALERKNIQYDKEQLKEALIFEFKLMKAKHFEDKLKRDPNKRTTIKEIENLNGFEFEQLIGNLFKKAGYKVKVTKKSGDQGADLIIEKDGVATAIQTKKYNGNVGNSAVQEVVAAMKYYDCDKAMVITTGHFTKGAFELASRNGVRLIDKKELDDLFDEVL